MALAYPSLTVVIAPLASVAMSSRITVAEVVVAHGHTGVARRVNHRLSFGIDRHERSEPSIRIEGLAAAEGFDKTGSRFSIALR